MRRAPQRADASASITSRRLAVPKLVCAHERADVHKQNASLSEECQQFPPPSSELAHPAAPLLSVCLSLRVLICYSQIYTLPPAYDHFHLERRPSLNSKFNPFTTHPFVGGGVFIMLKKKTLWNLTARMISTHSNDFALEDSKSGKGGSVLLQ